MQWKIAANCSYPILQTPCMPLDQCLVPKTRKTHATSDSSRKEDVRFSWASSNPGVMRTTVGLFKIGCIATSKDVVSAVWLDQRLAPELIREQEVFHISKTHYGIISKQRYPAEHLKKHKRPLRLDPPPQCNCMCW